MGGGRHIIGLVAVVLAVPARADDATNVHVSGYVDVAATVNPNRPADAANFLTGTGTTGKRANEVTLSQGVVQLSAPAAPVGFTLAIGWGSGLEVLHAAETVGTATGPNVWRHVLQASVVGRVPWGRGLTLEAGIFPSHIGLETFASKDNWSYSRGWMGEYSPYYQAGLKAIYAFTDGFAAQLHLLNGWQVIGDPNEGKAVGAQLAWTFERGSITLNGFAGPELPRDGEHWRLFGDLVATWKPTSVLAFSFTADAGRQSLPGGTAAIWYAAGANTRFAFTDTLALAVRVEAYRDVDGFITGTAQTLLGATTTIEWRPVDTLILKLEGRYDRSTAPVFSGHELVRGQAHTVRDEPLFLAGAVVTF